MTGDPFALPIRYVDASILNDTGTEGAPWWLSGAHSHDNPVAALRTHETCSTTGSLSSTRPAPSGWDDVTGTTIQDAEGWIVRLGG